MTRDPADVLIIEDERPLALALATTVRRCGGVPRRVSNLSQARRAIQASTPAAIILDIGLPDGNGLHLLEEFPALPPTLIVTAHGEIENAIRARKRGVHEFFDKPIDFEAFRNCLTAILQQNESALLSHSDEEASPLPFIGAAPSMRPVFQKVAHACASREPVLISGDTGTGRTMVARLIAREEILSGQLNSVEWPHFDPRSPRDIADACLTIDPVTQLDEERQQSLLETISDERASPGRIIATASPDLREQVRSGSFSSELYYRLQVLEIRLPPLRERKEDIPALANYFLGQRTGDNVEFAAESIGALTEYQWPGNLRELKNVITYANTIRGRSPLILPDHLPEHLIGRSSDNEGVERQAISTAIDQWLGDTDELPDYKTLAGDLESLLIERLLQRFDNKMAPMARALRANRTTLRKKIRNAPSD